MFSSVIQPFLCTKVKIRVSPAKDFRHLQREKTTLKKIVIVSFHHTQKTEVIETYCALVFEKETELISKESLAPLIYLV